MPGWVKSSLPTRPAQPTASAQAQHRLDAEAESLLHNLIKLSHQNMSHLNALGCG